MAQPWRDMGADDKAHGNCRYDAQKHDGTAPDDGGWRLLPRGCLWSLHQQLVAVVIVIVIVEISASIPRRNRNCPIHSCRVKFEKGSVESTSLLPSFGIHSQYPLLSEKLMISTRRALPTWGPRNLCAPARPRNKEVTRSVVYNCTGLQTGTRNAPKSLK